jgi:hypothetical protein
MTTDIAHANGNAIAVLGGANQALASLGEWVQAARHARDLVAPLVHTAFVPDAYRPRVDPRATPEDKAAAEAVAVANATAAVLQGITLGIDPLMSLQQIYIVHGRPGMYAKMMVALVQSHGHDVWTEDLTDSRAVVCGRRAGKDYTERITITMEQARKAGWTKNEAYGKTPQDMLWARAAARVCDRIASDVLKGLTSVEEIQDTIQVTAQAGKGTRTVTPPKRAAAAITASEEPPLDAEPTLEATVANPPAEERINAAQLKKLHTMLGKAGFSDRDDGLAYLSTYAGRDITSSKELTKHEAIQIINRLEYPDDPDNEPPLEAEPELEAQP